MDANISFWSLVINFVLDGVLILIFKQILESAHNRDMARLENENQKNLVYLNAQIDKITRIQLTQFASLHERRAHVIVELYKLLAQAEARLKYAHFPTPAWVKNDFEKNKNDSWWERALIRLRPTTEAIDALTAYYTQNAIVLLPSQVEKMNQIMLIVNNLRSSVIMQEMQRISPPEDKAEKEFIDELTNKSLTKALTSYELIYPQLKQELETEFRSMLGFDIDIHQPIVATKNNAGEK